MSRVLKLLSIVVCLLGFSAVPSFANSLDFAAVTAASCSSYSVDFEISSYGNGASYTINYTLVATPTSGTPLSYSGTTTFNAPNSGYIYQLAPITVPIGPLHGSYTLSGTATLTYNVDGETETATYTFAGVSGLTESYPAVSNTLSCGGTPPCTNSSTSNTGSFSSSKIPSGDYIWFNANFDAYGVPSSGGTVSFTGSTISFKAGGTSYNLAVPNATVTFSPSVVCPSLNYDSITNTFIETVPVAGSDSVFLTGLAFPVPSSFGAVSGGVTWSGNMATSSSAMSLSWKWGAAVYSQFTTSYNQLNIKPMHNGFSSSCSSSFNNSDQAGTPEGVNPSTSQSWQAYLTSGGTGGGICTGSFTQTVYFTPQCKCQGGFGNQPPSNQGGNGYGNGYGNQGWGFNSGSNGWWGYNGNGGQSQGWGGYGSNWGGFGGGNGSGWGGYGIW